MIFKTFSRRSFLKASFATALTTFPTKQLYAQEVQQPAITLNAQVSQHQFSPELPKTELWSYGSQGLSPQLRFRQGEALDITVQNSLKEDITVHWHGLRVPNQMDGVPNVTQKAIAQGESFNYNFGLEDAGTYWYHAHGSSPEQVGRGLAGALIVEEKTPLDVDTDKALLIQDWRLNNKAQLVNDFNNRHDSSHAGHLGNVVTINGQILPQLAFEANTRVRLRLINASTARIYVFNLPEPLKAWVVAKDGQPIQPETYKTTPLGPGMRMDIVFDMPESGTFDVEDTGYSNYIAFQLKSLPSNRSKRPYAPEAIQANPIPSPNIFNADVLDMKLQGGAMSGMSMMARNNIWHLNIDNTAKSADGLATVTLEQNKSYILNIKNDTAFFHPMHFHGHTFKVITKSNSSLANPYYTDTLLIAPREELGLVFTTNNVGDWLFHCHTLGHQHNGMKLLFRI